MELSPYLLLSVVLLLGAVIFVALKQRTNRLGPLQLLTADAFLPHLVVNAAQQRERQAEGFANTPDVGPEAKDYRDSFPLDAGISTTFRPTFPTLKNPFMNVLNDEITYNPERAAAAPIDAPLVKQSLDDYFRTNFYNDPTDVFGKQQDQRQYYTVPSTSIPNDRESLQNWLYNIYPKNCKSGNKEACYAGTDGGPITSLNQYY
jgi:hypothetical protein